jgi:beta-lactamase regulating signal transducer with metallopeptidase domain
MDKLFLTVLNMSVTASVVIAVVWAARLALRCFRAPKVAAYALWAVALFNLLCPFKPESVLSLHPFKPAPIPLDIGMQTQPRIDTGVAVINSAVSAALPAAPPVASVNPLQIWTTIGAYVWLIGMAAMLVYAVVSYALLKRKLRFATKREGGVYETDAIPSPFVLGSVRPKIYLPVGLADADLEYILRHERTHIRRRDYLVKPLAFLALALHWFNPLVWLAYFLLGADIEMSCDEQVLREMGETSGASGEAKAIYSAALLNLATGRRLVGLSPLAFGEGGVKERVKNVLNFRKPSRVIMLAAVVVLAVVTVGFAVNRASGSNIPIEATISYEGKSSTITLGDGTHIPYVELGSTVSLNFKGGRPTSVGVIEIIVRSDGSRRYNEQVDKALEVSYSGSNLVTFTVEKNMSDVLSSDSRDYAPGNSFRWYRIICNDNGESTTEHGLWLRTDPAILFEQEPSSDLSHMPALRTPYVGNNSAVGKIVDALPPLGYLHKQKFFSIGDDYGTGLAPNTLTVYYEQDGKINDEYAVGPRNAVLLFALIDNLEEVSYSIRTSPSGETLDKSAYLDRVTYNRADLGEYLATVGLTWGSFRDDWDSAVEKAFGLIGTGALADWRRQVTVGNNMGAVRELLGEPKEKPSDLCDIYEIDGNEVIIYYEANTIGEIGVSRVLINGEQIEPSRRQMTIADVREIARSLGEYTTLDEAMMYLKDNFIGEDIGSGFWIMRFGVEDGKYQLTAHQAGGLSLMRVTDGASIDLRYYDVDAFLAGEIQQIRETPPPPSPSVPPAKTPFYAAPAVWSPDMTLGATGVPSLDYASDKYIILHSYFGMFVYDLESRRMIRSLDLAAIGCHYTQGSDYCEVAVSADGGKVFLRTMETRKMYVWDLTAEPDSSLYAGDYDLDWPEPDERFRTVSVETAVGAAYSGAQGRYSDRAADFGGYYGYLFTSDSETIGGLWYCVDDMVFSDLFSANAYGG